MGKPSKSGILVCQGAVCSCTKAGGKTVKLKVVTQQKHYVNDANGSQKPIATDKESTVASLDFGTCRPRTKKAHRCNAKLKWKNFYDAIELQNGGSPLLDKSTAKCSDDSGTITIIKHGQTESVSSANIDNADETVQAQLNPMVNLQAVDKESIIVDVKFNIKEA